MTNKKSLLTKFTLLFLIILPFFSTIYLHKRIFTLVEVLFILFIFISTILIVPKSRKNIKYIILYIFFACIYLLISYLRSKHFYSLVPGDFNYSFFDETLTVIKLISPALFIYSLYYQKIEFKYYLRIINYWTLLIGLSIIISSIFEIGYSSYGNVKTTANIFEWISSPYYIDASCRGFFMYANQIAIELLMLLLVNVYTFLEGKNISFINVFIIVLTMLILGTRVSTMGGLLTFICIIIMYFIISLFHKTKISKRVILLFIPLSLFILLPTSPYSNRVEELEDYQEYEQETIISSEVVKEQNEKNVVVKKIDRIEYVYNNYNPNYLPLVFFEKYYPIKYDESFWYSYVKNNKNKSITYRDIEQSIVKRIMNIDNKNSNYLFGISNSRIQNVVNIENDFILHFYAFGIIGSIVLLFYYLVLLVYVIIRFFKKQDYFTFILATAYLLYLFSSYLTGNIINSLNITIPCLFIISGIFTNGLKKE